MTTPHDRAEHPASVPLKIYCRATHTALQDGGHEVVYEVFDSRGNALERTAGLTIRTRPGPTPTFSLPAPAPISPRRVAGDLEELLPDFPHSLAFLNHDEIHQPESVLELTRTEIERIQAEVGKSRHVSALIRLVATRRAAAAFAQRRHNSTLIPTQVFLAHPEGAKPEMRYKDAALESLFSGVTLSLADSQNYSVAVVGPGPIGVDWQHIEIRDADDWRRRLGKEGYALALALAARSGESLDCAATRVATLFGAARNALLPTDLVPSIGEPLGDSYLTFNAASLNPAGRLISVLLHPHRPGDKQTILTLFYRNRSTEKP